MPEAEASGALGRIADRALQPAPVASSGAATDVLFARLTQSDIEATESSLNDEHRAEWEGASDAYRKRLALAFGLYYGIPGIPERTGLSAATPPPGVHSMTQGWVGETGGSYEMADMVLEALAASGQALKAGDRVLDFSCSSGRVVRPLVAVHPEVSWHGCDPNAGAIEWIRGNLDGIHAFVSDTSPPLPFDEGALAAAFAISVWSHYSARAALTWFREMHRVIRPGGHLIFTTHGLQSCVWFGLCRDPGLDAKLGSNWIPDAARELQTSGHYFADMFGKTGDWGVKSRDWGIAFFTPEWLLAHVSPDWALKLFRIGRASGNQDLFVLERR